MIALLLACTSERPVELPTEDTASTSGDTVVLSSTPCDACGGDCLIEEIGLPDLSPHVSEPIAYSDRPPAGGPHNPCWSTWGVHRAAVPDENWVHNLEHGGVVYLYQDSVPSAVLDLEALADEKGDFVLVTPYAEMEAAYAAVAWGWRLTAGCVDPVVFGQFYDDHVDQAPESVSGDPGAACQ